MEDFILRLMNAQIELSPRALRRHHRHRLLNRRKHYWGGAVEQSRHPQRVIHSPKPCSCHLCGNPRKFWKEISRQEKLWEEIAREMWEGLAVL